MDDEVVGSGLTWEKVSDVLIMWCDVCVLRCSHPSGHRGGSGRLRPGDVPTLHRQITGGKSLFFHR